MTAQLLEFYYTDYCYEHDDNQEITVFIQKVQMLGQSRITYTKNSFVCPYMNQCHCWKEDFYCSVYHAAPNKP